MTDIAAPVHCHLLPLMRRHNRVHWNAAAPFANLQAHLLSMLEEWTPLPTDLCALVLEWVGEKLDACLPLPAGRAQVQVPDAWHARRGALQLRAGAAEASSQLPFRGGGFLELQGPLFDEESRDSEHMAWYVLRTVVSPTLRAQRIVYHDKKLIRAPWSAEAASSSSEDEGTCSQAKRRRVDKSIDPRWSIHQQAFAYYQVLPFGVNLLRDPSHADAIGLVSGVCLLFGSQEQLDPVGGSATYSVKEAALTRPDHLVTAYFRPPGVCEWNGGRCSRHAADRCVHVCCSAAHCAASARWRPCELHAL